MEEIKIRTDYIKLGQLLKIAGVVDRGSDVKFIILDHDILLNGAIVKERGKKVYQGDCVEVMSKKFLVKGL